MFNNTNGVKNRQIYICLFFLLSGMFTRAFADQSASQTIEKNHSYSSASLQTISAESTIQKAIEKAKNLKLADNPYWLSLLHYKDSVFGYKSTISNKEFFLSQDGNKNSEAELFATIREFINGNRIEDYPARYKWLKTQLDTDSENFFDDSKDEKYQETKRTFAPSNVYIIFPAGYLKNPASIFGHTLLVFEAKDKPLTEAQTFAFIARETDTSTTAIALKGLAGLYSGYYKFVPYSKQISKYSEKEMRDIWEYKIKISEEQTDLLLRHALELQNASEKYFFLSQNCTFGLMETLQAAFPDKDLVHEMGPISEPVEAIKLLFNKGLTEIPVLRPSIATKLEYEQKLLTKDQLRAVENYVFGKIKIAEFNTHFKTDEEKMLGYNTTINAMKTRVYKSLMDREVYAPRAIPMGEAADKIAFTYTDKIESTDYPHNGHNLHKLAVAAGKDDGKLFTQVYFRFASQDLIDCDAGMLKNTQLSFFSTSFSFFPNTRKVRLDTFDIVDIMTIPTSDRFSLDPGTEIKFGIERNQTSKDDDNLALRVKNHYGASANLGKANQFYMLAGIDAFLNPYYRYWVDFIPGAQAGLITSVGIWKQHLYASYGRGFFAANHNRFMLKAEESVAISRNTMLAAGYIFSRDYGSNKHRFSISAHLSF